MPTTTYMVVDPRHDHSFRVPRPDLSVTLGVPNACTRCHADRPAAWAAKQVETWYGRAPRGYQRYAEAFGAAAAGAPGAGELLAAVARDGDQPAIARATAIARLGPGPGGHDAARAGLKDADPLVRRAAATALESLEPARRVEPLAPLLDDPRPRGAHGSGALAGRGAAGAADRRAADGARRRASWSTSRPSDSMPTARNHT